MSKKWILFILISVGTAAAVFGLTGRPHEFADNECALCHYDEINDPLNINPTVTEACWQCHLRLEMTQSHPTDIYPSMPIPADMPLMDGMLTCLTCHYVHPREKGQFVEKHFFLRRMTRGPFFCNICHKFDNRGHIIIADAHEGKYTITDHEARIDGKSRECIECHDKYYNEPVDFLGSGQWDHADRKLSHPIGVSYGKASMKNMQGFRPQGMIPTEFRFFDGKVGCGTCHNIYSKNKFMLVVDNTRSSLCIQCHIK